MRVREREGTLRDDAGDRSDRRRGREVGAMLDREKERDRSGRERKTYEPTRERLAEAAPEQGRERDERRREYELQQRRVYVITATGSEGTVNAMIDADAR